MKLYHPFRSGRSHRLRIAHHLMRLAYDYGAIDLRHEERHGSAFTAINPQGMVPARVDGERTLIQSPALIEWLEERYPTPALLPAEPEARARVRALATVVGCEIHTLNNRRVLESLRHGFACDEAAVLAWSASRTTRGFEARESLLIADTPCSRVCLGDTPTLADVYRVPQIASARRFRVDLASYPRRLAIDRGGAGIDAFRRAEPALQPGAC